MFVIIGYVVIIGCVLGGFIMAGGHMHVLWQPIEVLVICGSAGGAFVIGNPPKVIKAVLHALPTVLKNAAQSKARYMALMAMLFDVLSKIRKEGLMSVEKDVEEPEQSATFQKYPEILADHHLMEFITDYLRLMVSGNLNPLEIEALMDSEIETHHHEAEIPGHAVQKIADGLPAFGIVAAVLGVVHTMGSVGQPPAVLGGMIAAALVGTFLGILMAYGFVGPLADLLGGRANEATKEFECIKVTLLASLNGYSPALAIEFGRKVLYSTERPTFSELENHVKQNNKK